MVGVAAVVALVLAVGAVGVLLFLGGGGDASDTTLTVPDLEEVEFPEEARDDLAAALAAIPELEGDTDAEKIRSYWGVPDIFELSFEDDDGTIRRWEMWFYFDIGIAYEFLDQAILTVHPIDEPEGLFAIPLRYDPLEFAPDTTLDHVRAMMADPASLGEEPPPPEYELGVSFWVGEQLAIVVDAEQALVLVESFALAMQGASE
jgi:hypothetical protein